MADFTAYRVGLLGQDYPTKYDNFVLALQGYATEVENGRQGQPSLAANFGRYILASQGLTMNLAAGGFRITGLPTPVAADEPATKAFAEGLAFAPALPGQAGNAGLEVITNGTTAGWGVSVPGAIAILNSLGFYG
jgi:hypothetical protein